METKPYNLQSPEQIAKDYGGNKQKIAEAMQMGIVDPTAGTLAGMFIDRMRSAQMQEQAPQQTVAEQVFAPPQPAPVAAPPMGGAPAGLGATPEAAQMAQQMPPMLQQEAPVGMAAGGMFEAPYMKDGGLSELPIPDGMFDENRDGSYAGGGLVAFAQAGEVNAPGNMGAYIEKTALSVFPGLEIAGRGRTAARNAQVGGVANSYHLLDAARDLRTPAGMSKDQFIAKLKETFGPDYDVLPSKGNSVHVEPGKKLGASVRAGTATPGAATAPGTSMASPGNALWGGSLASQIPNVNRYAEDFYAKNMPVMKNEGINALAEEARKVLSSEEQKKRRDQDKWATLAEIGFGIAGSSSPYLLQAVGAAASAALPGARAAKKEREAEKRQAFRDLAEAEGITYKQAMDKANYVRDVAKDRYDILDKDITRGFNQQQVTYQEGEATKRTGMQVGAQLETARINREGQLGQYDKLLASQVMGARGKATAAFDEARGNVGTRVGGLQAQIDSEKDPARKKKLEDQLTTARNDFIRTYVIDATGYDISAGMPGGNTIDFVDLNKKK